LGGREGGGAPPPLALTCFLFFGKMDSSIFSPKKWYHVFYDLMFKKHIRMTSDHVLGIKIHSLRNIDFGMEKINLINENL
jgi:hypothetical protein